MIVYNSSCILRPVYANVFLILRLLYIINFSDYVEDSTPLSTNLSVYYLHVSFDFAQCIF